MNGQAWKASQRGLTLTSVVETGRKTVIYTILSSLILVQLVNQ